ncbi:MAG: peroxidase [Gemmatimonadota bacterium]|nr:peroxidase [Gemmatimonadota bacterium]
MHQLAADWRQADLPAADRALCAFAEKLSLDPHASTAADMDGLREHGFDDRAIHDTVQIIGFFNYINRVADALGVEPETFTKAWEKSGEDQTGEA